MPVGWNELTERLDPLRLTARTLPARFRRLRRDAWADYFASRQRLTDEMIRAATATSAHALRRRA